MATVDNEQNTSCPVSLLHCRPPKGQDLEQAWFVNLVF